MSDTAANSAVPARAGERLVGHIEAMLGLVRTAMSDPEADRALAARWRSPWQMLQRELALAREGAARLSEQNEPDALVARARELCFLARRMDGAPMRFAGNDWAEKLVAQRRLIVLTAGQIVAAADGTGASGL